MAICTWCNRGMLDIKTNTCEGNKVVEFPDGTKLTSIPYTGDRVGRERCHDCNIKRDGNHHPGCDMERCPKCDGQLISCGHLDDERGSQ